MRDKLISVGIDIGTSTTQIMFSHLIIENMASDYAVPRLEIVSKEIIYESDIYFTPLRSQTQIDTEAIQQFVADEYRKAGITSEQVKTGAVIITGETARKENAALVLDTLSGFAGEFVVATAGPDLESVLAGYGSGAGMLSQEKRCRIANLDIGGGTSNIAVFDKGHMVGATCLDVGGRLVKIDKETGKITYIYHKWQKYLQNKGIEISAGMDVNREVLRILCREMAEILALSLRLSKDTTFHEKEFYTNDGKGLSEDLPIDGITFSGGVASLIYQDSDAKDDFPYGDIGDLLAQEIRANKNFARVMWYKPKETIRATVVGAGMYTTQISGSTICYSQECLPIRNAPVLHIKQDEMSQMGAILKQNLPYYIQQTDSNMVAIGFDGFSDISFDGIQKNAKEIYDNLDAIIEQSLPVILIMETDIAKALGFSLKRLLPVNYPLICIDGVRTKNGDYIDIGEPVAAGQVLPVVIKTLVFNT